MEIGASGMSGFSGMFGTNGLMDKQTLGAQLVKTTLDTMHSDPVTGVVNDVNYNFQNTVLQAAAMPGKGTKIDTLV